MKACALLERDVYIKKRQGKYCTSCKYCQDLEVMPTSNLCYNSFFFLYVIKKMSVVQYFQKFEFKYS